MQTKFFGFRVSANVNVNVNASCININCIDPLQTQH